MELDLLIMPYCAKTEIVSNEEEWEDDLLAIKEFFISEEIYTTGPVIFTKEVAGLGEYKFVVYIPLNAPIDPIPELNISYEPLLDVLPTISHKCFYEEEFEGVYDEIKNAAHEKDITLENSDFYHVLLPYPGGHLYEIHAEVNVDEEEM